MPNRVVLQQHLKEQCRHLSLADQRKFSEVDKILFANATKKTFQNRYDYGSLYEVVDKPKLPRDIQDLTPGSASPAAIYSAQEHALLRRATLHERQKLYHNDVGSKAAEDTDLALPGADDYNSDAFDEAQREPYNNYMASTGPLELDDSILFTHSEDEPGADDEQMPAGTFVV